MRFLSLIALLLPLSAAAIQPRLDRLAAVPQALLPAAEVKQDIERHKGEPLRYAVGHALLLDQRSGAWDEAAPGIARWRLRVSSEGARSLSLHLKNLQLPEGAQLWLSGTDGHDVQGPFTAAVVRDRELWLPIVRAADAVLEVQVPAVSQPALTLQVAEAFHGYRSLFEGDASKANVPGAEQSGSCNVNTACSAGNNWRNEIRSAVQLSTSGISLCSGTLMNNTRLDDRPLVLTANHCGIRSSNVRSVVAYFNYQSSSCSRDGDAPVNQTVAGGSFLAGSSNLPDNDIDTDFTLITLTSTVPASFNALFAGWDARSSATPSSGVAIHHPQGDEKKISTYSTAASKAENQKICTNNDCTQFFFADAWQVVWAQGTTEAGSSGSALWNHDHRVVGTLSGGGASCGTPTDPDLFGRLERAWTAGSASNGQLKAHLDPTGTAASLTLNSKEAGTSGTLPDAGSGTSGGDSGSGGGGGSPGPALLAGLALLAISRRACRAAAAA